MAMVFAVLQGLRLVRKTELGLERVLALVKMGYLGPRWGCQGLLLRDLGVEWQHLGPKS